MISPHFLENYFAEVKIKNDHTIDKMEDRVKHAVNKYDERITVKPKQMEALCHVLKQTKQSILSTFIGVLLAMLSNSPNCHILIM